MWKNKLHEVSLKVVCWIATHRCPSLSARGEKCYVTPRMPVLEKSRFLNLTLSAL